MMGYIYFAQHDGIIIPSNCSIGYCVCNKYTVNMYDDVVDDGHS